MYRYTSVDDNYVIQYAARWKLFMGMFTNAKNAIIVILHKLFHAQ